MKNRPVIYSALAAILILACSCPLSSAIGINSGATGTPAASGGANTPTGPLPTSTIPLGSPNGQPLNCRSGPGVDWPVVIVLNPGDTAEIVGKSPDGAWWYVKNPSVPGTFCWISFGFTSTSGDLSGVPVVGVPSQAAPTGSAAGVVTNVTVSIQPDSIHVPGCMKPSRMVRSDLIP